MSVEAEGSKWRRRCGGDHRLRSGPMPESPRDECPRRIRRCTRGYAGSTDRMIRCRAALRWTATAADPALPRVPGFTPRQMYFFGISDKRAFQRDDYGAECRDLCEAREQAQRLLVDLSADKRADGVPFAIRCDVRDVSDQVVYKGEISYRGRATASRMAEALEAGSRRGRRAGRHSGDVVPD